MIATSSRMVVAPFIFVLFWWQNPAGPWVAAVLFILASLTDWLDGYWARIYKAESNMGKFMDPIADKILVLSVLIILVYNKRIDPISPTILMSRDIFIGGIRSVAATENVIISAKPTGKWKTGVQMFAIPCLFVDYEIFGFTLQSLGVVALWLSVVLSLVSAYDYTMGYFKGAKNL